MAELFHYTFATDLSEFSGVSATNGTIAQSAGAGLNGTTGGVLCTRTANSPSLYGTVPHVSTGLTALGIAWYVDFASLTISTNTHAAAIWSPRSGGGAAVLGILSVVNSSGVLTLWVRALQDSLPIIEDLNPLVAMDWIEMSVVRETTDGAADGILRCYAGGGAYAATGELVSELTGLNNYITFQAMTNARMGIVSGSASVGGTLKIDEIIARNDNTPIIFGVSADAVTWRSTMLSHSLGVHF